MHNDLKPEKVRTVARVAKFFVDKKSEQTDRIIEQQMVREGIRKIHDAAKSFRGIGKYCGHAHWSVKALELLESNRGRVKGITDDLAHEHVIPVSVLVGDMLFKNPPGTELEKYESQICEFSIVAIITDEEHKKLNKMPEGWQVGSDPWARYIQAGLRTEIRSGPSIVFTDCK